jgi:hypothetical protein
VELEGKRVGDEGGLGVVVVGGLEVVVWGLDVMGDGIGCDGWGGVGVIGWLG